MQETPSPKAKALVEKLRQTQDPASDGRASASELHLRRAEAAVVLSKSDLSQKVEINHARFMLNDLSFKEVVVFATGDFKRGQDVVFQVEQLDNLYLRGKVASSHLFMRDVRIISSQSYRYRVKISFSFASTDDQSAFEKYCTKLLGAPAAAA